MSKINILHVFGTLDRGGSESMIMNLYRKIDREKYQFNFVVHSEKPGQFEEEIEKLGGKIYRVPKFNGINYFQYIKSWKKLLDEVSYNQIIHSHVLSTASIFLKLAQDRGYHTIVHSHTAADSRGIKGIIKSFMYRNVTSYSDTLLACGIDAGEYLYGANSDFKVIPNSININEYNRANDGKITEEENMKSKKYVHVGRFNIQKNHSFLIDIFSEIIKQDPESILFLVGTGELKTEIENKINKLSLSNNIKLLGTRSDVPKILQSMDYFIMPSFYEGLPVTLVESQAAGLKVFASDSITKEVNLTNTISYISLDKSAKEWSNEILKFEKKSEEEKNEMYKIISASDYNVEKSVVDLQKFYESIIT